MSGISVTVDNAATLQMLDDIDARLRDRREIRNAISAAASEGAGMVSGVPDGPTGELARQVTAKMLTNAALILSTAEDARGVRYGRFVFADQPPNIPEQAIADLLADKIAAELFT